MYKDNVLGKERKLIYKFFVLRGIKLKVEHCSKGWEEHDTRFKFFEALSLRYREGVLREVNGQHEIRVFKILRDPKKNTPGKRNTKEKRGSSYATC